MRGGPTNLVLGRVCRLCSLGRFWPLLSAQGEVRVGPQGAYTYNFLLVVCTQSAQPALLAMTLEQVDTLLDVAATDAATLLRGCQQVIMQCIIGPG